MKKGEVDQRGNETHLDVRGQLGLYGSISLRLSEPIDPATSVVVQNGCGRTGYLFTGDFPSSQLSLRDLYAGSRSCR